MEDVKRVMPSSEPSQTGAAPALRRAVQVLDLVSRRAEPVAAADVARELSIPKSSAHGLIATMTELELLTRSPDGSLRLGSRLMRWANGFLSQTDLVGEFQRFFADGGELGDHTLTLTMLEGREVVYVGCRNNGEPLGLTFRIGMRLPAPYTATGKALLAAMPTDELDRLFADPADWPAPLTPLGVGSLRELRRELGTVRAQGYSIDDGQVREGMVCIGAAIRDHSGRAVAGIAVSLLRGQAQSATLKSLGARLQTAADAFSRRLGN